MEQINDAIAMLEWVERGAFCVKNGRIVAANDAARKRMVCTDVPVTDILLTGAQEYEAFQRGCLYLTVTLAGVTHNACAVKADDCELFFLEREAEHCQLQALALAAQELRQPLNHVLSAAERLLPGEAADNAATDSLARMNRGLLQLLRMVGNMSDAYRYGQEDACQLQTRNICALIDACLEAVRPLVEAAGFQIRYTRITDATYCLADDQLLERAVYNILSNAMKFSPAKSVIDVRLSRRGRMLYLTVQDQGAGLPDSIRDNVYFQFCREPGLEDSRRGIGLGMVLIRSAAAAHGGTVLLEQGADIGNRLTMTLSIRQSNDTGLCSKVLKVDYAGERDHRLIELSDCLPADLYK